ncbi:GNAT family N-acetyltransferase [Tropicimonas sp. TH_r6]|uniref:GNAT family N-acetyltransferase n=1 Tax=Tropicimonas sp. TH_r6 TaxID=3082085 RepID=UPI0029532828|nr:GNAT family N-acetyltransferase [Tropicimonas sp. TH_r6]MDV7142695.1 GNAT family N-acetyltransferase [Tropicimonas sp. TH_r6]
MRFREAVVSDAEAIEAFLVGHCDTSMFLRGNLARFGPCGGEDRNATRMWLRETAGVVDGVFGITTAGFVLVQLPGTFPSEEFAETLAEDEINAILGATEQVHAARCALGLNGAPVQLDEDEPLYALDLDELVLPRASVSLRSATKADTDLLLHWRASYLVETIHFTPEEAMGMAEADIEGMLERGTLMLLENAAGETVAMTSFNAILTDTVQVGNVYTPDEVRGQGHARRAVALHLERARAEGVKRAILFASGPAASRAYEAIGFRLVGRFTLLFFADTQSVGAAA